MPVVQELSQLCHIIVFPKGSRWQLGKPWSFKNPVDPTGRLKGFLLLLCGFFPVKTTTAVQSCELSCPLHSFSTHGGHTGVRPAHSTCTGMPCASSNTKTREEYESLLAGILRYKVSHRVGTDRGQLMAEIRLEVSVSLECRWTRGLWAFSQISSLSLWPGSHRVFIPLLPSWQDMCHVHLLG